MSKTIALLLAGGSGTRMGQDIPKQFLSVNDKPVIVYTLETFQSHPEVDEIAVACLGGWETVLAAYAHQFGISKLVGIYPGGANGLESTENVAFELERDHDADDVVLVSDGVRPLLPASLISTCIETTRLHGDATPVVPSTDTMYVVDGDEEISHETYPRESLKRGHSPLGFRLGFLCDMLREGRAREDIDSEAPGALMMDLGYSAHLCEGSSLAFKLTTVEDVDMFKAMLNTERAPWLK